MQMLQIVTFRGDYQYQIAHFCIINSTKDTIWDLIFFCDIKRFTLKRADNKITD